MKYKEKTNKAPGHDDIRINVLNKIAPYIVQPLKHIIYSSFQSGIVPNETKVTKLTSIFSSGNNAVFSNYGLVSVLLVFSKVLEKLFYKRLIEYIITNSILFDGQYIFREKSLALVDLMENITKSVDKDEYTIVVLIDQRKVFDTINQAC